MRRLEGGVCEGLRGGVGQGDGVGSVRLGVRAADWREITLGIKGEPLGLAFFSYDHFGLKIGERLSRP